MSAIAQPAIEPAQERPLTCIESTGIIDQPMLVLPYVSQPSLKGVEYPTPCPLRCFYKVFLRPAHQTVHGKGLTIRGDRSNFWGNTFRRWPLPHRRIVHISPMVWLHSLNCRAGNGPLPACTATLPLVLVTECLRRRM